MRQEKNDTTKQNFLNTRLFSFLIHDYFVSADGKIGMRGLVNLRIR